MKKSKKFLSLLLAALMILSLLPTFAFATVSETDVAKIGETGYATLQAAATAAASMEGNTEIEIIKAGEYSVDDLTNLGGKQVTIKGLSDRTQVVLTKTGLTGQGCQNCTFKDLTLVCSGNEAGFNNNNPNYTNPDITFDNCVIKGNIKGYGPLTFTNCSFIEPGDGGKVNMTTYAADVTCTNCTFDGSVNIWWETHNIGRDVTVSFTSCKFEKGNSVNKKNAALFVKTREFNASSHKLAVTLTGCTFTGYENANLDGNGEYTWDSVRYVSPDGKWQINGLTGTNTTVRIDNTVVFPFAAPLTSGSFAFQDSQAGEANADGLVDPGCKVVKTATEAGTHSNGNKYYLYTIVPKTYVAQIGDQKYETLAGAIAAANKNNTITLLDDVANVGEINLPANVTLDGANHKITGNSAIYINAAGGTVKNVNFENIHNEASIIESDRNKYNLTRTAGKLTAIYGNNLSGTATVTGCTFDNIDWDAIQISPVAGATVTVTNNTFKHTNKTDPAIRYVHVQSAKNVDFTATVTGNKFLNCDKLVETGIEVYYPKEASKLNCSGNYMDAPMGVCIGNAESFNANYAKAFPFMDATLENNVEIAITVFDPKENTYFYPTEADAIADGVVAKIGSMGYKTLAKAVAAVDGSETITLLDNITLSDKLVIDNKNLTLDLNSKTLTGADKAAYVIEKKTADVTIKNGTIKDVKSNTSGTVTAIDNSVGKLTLEDVSIIQTGTGTGLIAVKNEDYATSELIIKGNSTITTPGQAVQNWGTATLSGGTYNGKIRTWAYVSGGTTYAGNTTISGGIYNSSVESIQMLNNGQWPTNSANTTISGGMFNAGMATLYKDATNGYQPTADAATHSGADSKIVIRSGYFITDPSAYLASGYAVAGSDIQGYAYKVTELVKPENSGDIGVVSKQPEVAEISIAGIDEGTQTAIEAAAAETEVAGLATDALKEAAKVNADSAKAELIRASVEVGDDATVTVFAQTYLDVKPQEYDAGTNKVYTVDITPKVQLIATTAENADDINTTGQSGSKNAVALGEPTELEVNTPVVVTIPLPTGFATEGSILFVKHTKESGASYLYKCTVQEGASDQLYIQFVNNNGFSEFEITTVDTSVASIVKGGSTLYYTSLEAAVEAVADDETITLTKDCAEAVTVARAVRFTLATNDKNFSGRITPGANYKNNGTGNNYKFAYVVPTHHGGSSKPVTPPVVEPETSEFVDVPAKAYYAEAVAWAADNGITKGTDTMHFSPAAPVTRAQAVTFLWRAAGCPKLLNMTADGPAPSPFKDVATDAYYYDAVMWAVSEGITKGTTDTAFSPNATCTRGQIVTFLARFAGVKDDASGYSHNFTDVTAADYYNNAVAWAFDNGITGGTGATTFAPTNGCTRAQVVTFLHRYMVK